MKRFKSFVLKEFRHIFRDVRTVIILFGIPVAQILIFGYVVTNEVKDAKIAVLDLSKDEMTIEITNKLTSSGYFLLVRNLNSEDEIEEIFRKGEAREVIIFEPEFSSNFVKYGKANLRIITDASDANSANMLTNYTSAIVRDYSFSQNKSSAVAGQILAQSRMQFNQNLEGSYMFVPGTMALILMLVSAMMTSISITREKETGTMEVLLVSPLKPAQIIIGKVIPYVILSFGNAISILILGYFVFGLPVNGPLGLLLAESLLFIMMALSLGIFISTISKSQQVAMFISMFALMLPTMLLSGFIFPIENMPEVLQWLCNVMPPKYYITIVKNIMLKGTGFEFVWFETLVLLGMTVFFILLSIYKFKIRLD
ncbi:MAG: ABC transporter permease [Bacteroidales bacterium]|nr:ABC transporter permease [Bacteroidales bacterium]